MTATAYDIGNGFGMVAATDKVPVSLMPPKLSEGLPTNVYVSRTGEIKVGRLRQESLRTPAAVLHSVKTRLREKSVTLRDAEGEWEISPLRAYGAIAAELYRVSAEQTRSLGLTVESRIVLTYPDIYQDDTELLKAIREQVEQVKLFDGGYFTVAAMLPESAAAAIAYLHFLQAEAPAEQQIEKTTVLVCDIGHGTTDLAICSASSKEEPYQLHATGSLPAIGGQDFDRLLYDGLLRQLKEEYQYTPANENDREALRQTAVACKHALSETEEYREEIPIRRAQRMEYAEIHMTRAQLEKQTESLLYRILEAVQQLLEEAEVKHIVIEEIVLSGGGSRMPMVQNGIKQLTMGKFPVCVYRPSEAVAFGAALYAEGIPATLERGRKANRVMEQKTQYAYGLWIPAAEKREGEMRTLIPENTRLPFTSQPLKLCSAGKRMILRVEKAIQHTTQTAVKAEDTRDIWREEFILPKADTPVSITVGKDENGGLTVSCLLPDGSRQEKTTGINGGAQT